MTYCTKIQNIFAVLTARYSLLVFTITITKNVMLKIVKIYNVDFWKIAVIFP